MRSEIGDADGTGSDRVDGRLRPGNDVKRTLMICGAILNLSDGDYYLRLRAAVVVR